MTQQEQVQQDAMQATMQEKMLERINRGVEYLDSNASLFGDWLSAIDIRHLIMSSGEYCVLGQLGVSFSEFVDRTDMSSTEASSLGFLLDEEEYGFNETNMARYMFIYSQLTELWIVKIVALRSERSRHNSYQV